jgi:hypothetical protein
VHYKEQWKEEDLKLASLMDDGLQNPALAMNREYFEMEDTVYEGDVSMGPLSERLLGALVKESVVPSMDEEDDVQVTNKFVVRTRTKYDLCLYEERLKQELTNIGLLQKDEPDNLFEITTQLLAAQEELRAQLQINLGMKKKLLKVAEQHMAFQEYNTLMDDINKSVDQTYIKRFVLLF